MHEDAIFWERNREAVITRVNKIVLFKRCRLSCTKSDQNGMFGLKNNLKNKSVP